MFSVSDAELHSAAMLSLQQTPLPNDCKPIGSGYRVDSGEYHILYFLDDTTQLIEIVLVGK